MTVVCVDFSYPENGECSCYILSNVEIEFIRGYTGIFFATHLYCGFVLSFNLRKLDHGFGSYRPQRASQGPG